MGIVAKRLLTSLSISGLIIGAIFATWSLTPSLLPRNYLVQGALSGFALFVGYGFGRTGAWLWRYLEIPDVPAKVRRAIGIGAGIVLAATLLFTLSRISVWQNDLRALMDMPPLQAAYPLQIGAVAVVIALFCLFVTRVVRLLILAVKRQAERAVPRRIAIVVSTLVVGLLLLSLVNGFILKQALTLADNAFDLIDRQTAEGVVQPQSPLASGGPGSLIAWDDIGKQGKNFITSGPTAEEISALSGRDAMTPIRVYSGYRSGDTLEERADLTFNEMLRVGAFDRSVLVVATPTGTGWMDEAAMDTLEVLHNGDTAVATMQYSYLPSWTTLLIDPDRSKRAARALFDRVYDHWTQLPSDERPRLYAYGLSLGALGSEHAADVIRLLGDPINGAVFSGPPFPSTLWNSLTASREPDSPQWHPVFRDGSLARFTVTGDGLDNQNAAWGPLRLVYLQHASDPMSFFSTDLAHQSPDWLSAPRGPDVSQHFSWFPVVTFLQVAFDIPAATSVPIGYGHNFAPWEYIGAWVAVTEPPGWTEAEIEALKDHYRGQHLRN
ncbi:MAG: hypothetical protein GY798_26445 [Hyphomicrobiales bacterium]|nr:hypothetical protein [Hyphomicrobiales bacterium]